jgi:hypothetical protein
MNTNERGVSVINDITPNECKVLLEIGFILARDDPKRPPRSLALDIGTYPH